MATLLTTLPESAITMRYREPYLSKSLNAKLQTLLSPGIYSGMEITPSTALKIVVSAGVASVQSDADANAQITVQLTGSYELDLSTFPSGAEIAVCLEASYLFNTTTTAVVQGYNLSAETVPSTACVLGVVTRPAAGVIPVANISPTMRTFPWETRSAETVPRVLVTKNGNFSLAQTNEVPEFWSTTGTIGGIVANAVSPAGPSGYGFTLQATAASTATPQTRALVQDLAQPIDPAKDRVGVTVSYRAILAPTSGYPALLLYFKRAADNAAYYTVTLPLTAAVSPSYTTYEKVYDLQSLGGAAPTQGLYLEKVEISFNNAQYAATGIAFRVTDVAVTLESRTDALDPMRELGGIFRGTQLKLLDPSDQSAAGDAATVAYDSATNEVQVQGTATVPPAPPFTLHVYGNFDADGDAVVGGTLTVTGPIYIAALDYAGTMDIGTVLQTTLNIGRVGSPLTLKGSTVTVTAASSTTLTTTTAAQVPVKIQGAAGHTGDLTQWVTNPAGATPLASMSSAGNLLVAASVDRQTAGTLSLGTSTANAVNIAKTTATTAVQGPLSVYSTIDKISAGTLYIGSLATTTGLAIGGAVGLSALDIGIGAPTSSRTINIGTGNATAGRTITINIGTGGGAGTSVTNIQGDTLTIGTSADTTQIQIGNAARTLTIDSPVSATNTLTIAGITTAKRSVVIQNDNGAVADVLLTVQQGSAGTQTGDLQRWRSDPSWNAGVIDVASITSDGLLKCIGVDEIAAYPLEIGGTTATQVVLGRTTKETLVLGSLTVNETATIKPTADVTGTTLKVLAYDKGSAQVWRDRTDATTLASLNPSGDFYALGTVSAATFYTNGTSYRSMRFFAVEQARLYDPYIANGAVSAFFQGGVPDTSPFIRILDASSGDGASDVYFSFVFNLPPYAYVDSIRCGLIVYNQGAGAVDGEAEVTISCYRFPYNSTTGTSVGISAATSTCTCSALTPGGKSFFQVTKGGGNTALIQGDPASGPTTYGWKATVRVFAPEILLAGAAAVDMLYFDVCYATTEVRV